MVTSASTVPFAVIYLILVFFQGFGPAEAIDVDYLQDGVPALAVSAVSESGDDGRLYRIVARPAELSAPGEDQPTGEAAVRVEQSELASQNYLLYVAGRALPTVITLEPLLAQLATVSSARDRTLELPDTTELVGGEAEAALGATLHVLHRDGTTVISAPDTGIMLLIDHE